MPLVADLFAGDMLVHWYSTCKLFLQVPGIDSLAVAVKIDKYSVIRSKWAAVARCHVCNGILQRSAVPTGARFHPNSITHPDSSHFPITGSGKTIHTPNCLVSLWDIQYFWPVQESSVLKGQSEAVPDWAKGMEPEVCFCCWCPFIYQHSGCWKPEKARA